ncbi:NADH-quinone oxidoreductase subunit C [Sphingobacteriaceae bacterium WQ 2009]|uniref:NADH-quinone oxidoreductase subunit C n=2 Tax=Rhinopithecimicrobium faecis TaxID=2820698 RepID=A0A8T4HDQ6_9SPHI|nr:NADH-quinone oxidoreductase subunit C [Sphingobacteriaceae bacterium WQ 2009]
MELMPIKNPVYVDLWEQIQQQFPSVVSAQEDDYGMLTLYTSKEQIIAVLRFLKKDKHWQFIHLTDITAVHYPLELLPFTVVYHLQSLVLNLRIRLKVAIGGEPPEIPSATTLWPGANWMERETYDFFGIQFLGHPDLRRILNMDELEAFPMRKEYPLEDPNRVDKKDLYFGR